MKHLFNFMLSISFLIKHSGTGRAFKDTQRVLEHLGYLESNLYDALSLKYCLSVA